MHKTIKFMIYFIFFNFLNLEILWANPTGPNVVSGDVQVSVPSPDVTEIHQSSKNGVINWNNFNIEQGQRTSFYNGNGTTLNRVMTPQSPSRIFGTLTATGKIILVNPAGIFFGPNARVDVAGIIASTSDIRDDNFNAGKYIFDIPSSNAAIVNQGQIIARNGLVALMATNVSNEGYIQAHLGNVVLASGNKFTVDLTGDQLISFTIDEAANGGSTYDANGRQLKNAVNNSGQIYAAGGSIIMTARTASQMVDKTINMSGIAVANTAYEKNGEIILDAGPNGRTSVTGKLIAKGKNNQAGGNIKVLANDIYIGSNAVINASGDAGGGTILIGGNYQGKGPELNARRTIVDSGAQVLADALINGNGGKIIVWADDATYFHGILSAKGGVLGGNGGFAETSGKSYLNVAGIKVDMSAPNGNMGTWLLDPRNITISNSPDSGGSFSGGAVDVYTPSSDDSVINTTTLENALLAASVIISTGTTGSQAGDITIADDFSWSGGSLLQLDAARDILIQAEISGIQLRMTAGNSIVQNASGIISGTTSVLYNAPTLILNPLNSYSGQTTITNATVSIPALQNTGVASIFGTGSGVPTIGVFTSTLTFTGGATSTDRPFQFNNQDTIHLAGSGAVDFNGAISAVGSVALSLTGSGTVNFNNTVGTFRTISSASGVTLGISTNSITTTGAQTYNGRVSLGSNATFTGSDISFNNGIDGNNYTLSLVGNSSSSDAFVLDGSLANLASVAVTGGSGTNTLTVNASTGNTWNVTGSNSGNLTGPTSLSFSQIQNIVGSNYGDTFNIAAQLANVTGGASANRFNLSDGVLITGTLDGGSSSQTNVINAAAISQPVSLTLSGKTNGVLNSGTLTINGYSLSFNNSNSAIGNGGVLTVPDSVVRSIRLSSNTSGVIGDPFYFQNFIVPQARGNDTAIEVAGSAQSMTQSTASPPSDSIFTYVNDSINDIIKMQQSNDINMNDLSRFGCFN